MKIAVLVKEVPDTWGDRVLDASSGLLDRGASDAVLDEICERALEVALSYKDDNDAEVTVLTMGPASAKNVVRKALSMGADSGVHVLDDALAGADMVRTSEVLAAALRRMSPDLIVTGNESTDGRGGMMAAMLAEQLGVAQVTNLESVTVSADAVGGERAAHGATMSVRAALPAIISITERNPEGRFPSFKGIMKAKKKPVDVWSAADLQVASVPSAASVVKSVAQRPERAAGTVVVDDGTAAGQLAQFLSTAHLV